LTASGNGLHNELMHKGQALVVVLLVMAVVATVGLSVISRSVTEVTQSTVQEESARALDAAEVALEKYLGKVGPTPGQVYNLGNNTEYSISNIQTIALGQSTYTLPNMESGDVVTINMATYTGNHVVICWGTGTYTGRSNFPVMMVTAYYKDAANNYLYKTAFFDPDATPSPTDTELVITGSYKPGGPGATCGTSPAISYTYDKNVGFGNNQELNLNNGTLIFLRLRLLGGYGGAVPVAIQSGGDTFDAQAGMVEATGVAGESVQRIRAVIPNYDAPGVFDAAIFSGTGLYKIP
jgi:type II secretory pathway pseudopilin PulG